MNSSVFFGRLDVNSVGKKIPLEELSAFDNSTVDVRGNL